MTMSDEITENVNRNFPKWVPSAVRKFATFWEFDERCLPLLTDERMRRVWPVIMRQKLVNPAAFDAPYFAHAKRYLFSGGDNFSPSEIGCVVWFDRVQHCLNGDVVSRTKLDETLKPWRDAASFLMEIENGVAAAFDPKLAECAAYVRKYLEGNGAAIEHGAGRFVVDRSSNARGHDDDVRVVGRRVAATMLEIFGSPLYATTATIVTVLTGVPVEKKSIENWVKASQ